MHLGPKDKPWFEMDDDYFLRLIVVIGMSIAGVAGIIGSSIYYIVK